jgi:hypothetical protein
MGSGHGWAGANHVFWNCSAKTLTCQSPWVTGKNYCIGGQGRKHEGHFKGRLDGEWDGLNVRLLEPGSLYLAQLNDPERERI